jgi:glutathione S-transferase
MLTLVIGDKNLSSWSLRPWLVMKQSGIPFNERLIRLDRPDTKAEIARYSPSGRVPCLIDGDRAIWDSLAIAEYLAEAFPEKGLWPEAPTARAIARSVAAEMHSGFQALREHCPMKLLSTDPKAEFIEPVQVNIRRVIEIWTEARARFGAGGPFLFGRFSVADAMYAPVASRLKTYVPDLTAFGDDGTAKAYVETIFSLPALGEWAEGARQEIAG